MDSSKKCVEFVSHWKKTEIEDFLRNRMNAPCVNFQIRIQGGTFILTNIHWISILKLKKYYLCMLCCTVTWFPLHEFHPQWTSPPSLPYLTWSCLSLGKWTKFSHPKILNYFFRKKIMQSIFIESKSKLTERSLNECIIVSQCLKVKYQLVKYVFPTNTERPLS